MKMKCTIQTVTPLHIGNDKEYGPSEYYLGKSTKGDPILVKTDINQVFKSLSDEQRDEFIQHLTDPSFQLGDYLKNVLGKKPPQIKKYIAIIKAKNPQIIKEHIKTVEKPYIPGSSIKGAIRTATLYNVISYEDIDKIKEMVQTRNNKNFVKWGDAQSFQNQFFSNPGKNESYSSIFKFLQVTDTELAQFPSIYALVSLEVGKGGYEWYSRHGQTVISYAETIGIGWKLDFEMSSSYNSQVHRGLDVDDKVDYIEMDNLKEFLFNFSRDYIKNEIDFYQKYNVDFLEKFYSKLEDKNEPDSPLMRIGHGSGLLATTIGLKLKGEYPETYELIRRTFRRSYPFEFPKTRRLTGKRKPLGWVKVIFNE